MDYDTVMRAITSKLTREPNRDIPYLWEQCQKYKDHELSREIIRACGRLMAQMIPQEDQASLQEILGKNFMGYKAAIEEAEFNIYRKRYDVALQILEGMISKIESIPLYENDSVSEYHTFDEIFEELLYTQVTRPTRTLRPADPNWTRGYYLYGNLLFELKRYEEAQAALKKALRWNPVSAEINFEYIEIFKMLGDLDTFFQLTKDMFRYAFHASDIARVYRNLAYYFVEKELYNEAMGCLQLSGIFQESKTAPAEMYYILQLTQGKAKAPAPPEMKGIAERYGFSLGVCEDVIQLAYSLGMMSKKKDQKQAAKYYLEIVHDLTKSEHVKAQLKELENGT